MKVTKSQLKQIIKEELRENFLGDLANRYIDWVNQNVPAGPEAKAMAAEKREKVMQFINQHIDDYAFLMYLEEVLDESRWA